jgi:hypothetical protein
MRWKMEGKLLPVLWAAAVGFPVVDPLAATGLGTKGVELWNRWTKKG